MELYVGAKLFGKFTAEFSGNLDSPNLIYRACPISAISISATLPLSMTARSTLKLAHWDDHKIAIALCRFVRAIKHCSVYDCRSWVMQLLSYLKSPQMSANASFFGGGLALEAVLEPHTSCASKTPLGAA